MIKLPKLAILQMKALLWVEEGRLRKRIAGWSELITPHASPLLSLKKSWIHEEMATNCRDVILR